MAFSSDRGSKRTALPPAWTAAADPRRVRADMKLLITNHVNICTKTFIFVSHAFCMKEATIRL